MEFIRRQWVAIVRIEWLEEQCQKLRNMIKMCVDWLCFFYTDAYGGIVGIRMRKPYTKDIRYFKPFKETAGVFGPLVSLGDHGENGELRTLLVTEGEFNALQFCSLQHRTHNVSNNGIDSYQACAVGGVNNVDFGVIGKISNVPTIIYDNDKSGAGFQLVEHARHQLTIDATTTPETDSDLDKFICSFGEEYQAALEGVRQLLSQSSRYTQYYGAVIKKIRWIRRNKDAKNRPMFEPFEVNRIVARRIIEDLNERGLFYHDQGSAYFFRHEDRLLMPIYRDSDHFRLQMSMYELNPVESIYKYVTEALQIEVVKNGQPTTVYRFSYFDAQKYTLYFFDNNNQIYRITADTIDSVDNGTDGVLFLKDANADPFTIREPTANYSGFDEHIISKISFASEILGVEEKKVILTMWFYSLFFENIMKTKAILTFVGPKGSGKTSALAKIGALLVGDAFNVTPLSDDEKDFDAAITNQHLVVIDNADSAIKWFNNRLATSATGGTLKKRELYTTNKLIEFPIRSYIAITARTPKFRRDDVAERLLILKLDRISEFISENILREEISKNRDSILSEVVYHLQEIVGALKDNSERSNVGSFRMADFADFMLKIARYANLENFVKRILGKLTKEQSHFTLEDDATVELLLEWVKMNEKREVTSSELHHELSEMATEKQIDFFYKDKSRAFAYHLKNIVFNLADFLDIEENIVGGRKHLYRFSQKEDGKNYG